MRSTMHHLPSAVSNMSHDIFPIIPLFVQSNEILLQECPNVEGYVKSNGGVTAKILKGSGYYLETQT